MEESRVTLSSSWDLSASSSPAGPWVSRFEELDTTIMLLKQRIVFLGSQATEMGLHIREMAYHRVKMNKIFSRITGKPEKRVSLNRRRLRWIFSNMFACRLRWLNRRSYR